MDDDPELIRGSRDISNVDHNSADAPRSWLSVLQRGVQGLRLWHLVLCVVVSWFAQPEAAPRPAPALPARTAQIFDRVAAEVLKQPEQPPVPDPVPPDEPVVRK